MIVEYKKCEVGNKIHYFDVSQSKEYEIDPRYSLRNHEKLGEGTSGKVVKAHLKVIKGSTIKEKHCAIKIMQGNWGNEYKANLEIHRRIKENYQQLLNLGITPGTGIEKMPLFSFDLGYESCIVKQLYNKDLNQGIKEGLFKDIKLLITGSKQLIEGILTLMRIEALYFDIKPANILVSRKDKFELAFTDFEQLSFLQSKEQNAEIIKNTIIRMPPFLAHEKEQRILGKISKEHNPEEEYVLRLNKLYTFALGALFFEMTTQISLRKFIFLQSFINHLVEKSASEVEINKFWEAGYQINEKKYCELTLVLSPKYANAFTQYLFGSSRSPDVELLQTIPIRSAVEDRLCQSKAPKFYIDLVLSMLNVDWESRIDIQTSLSKINDSLSDKSF